VIIIGALSNLFLFYKATATAMNKVIEFKRRYND
jgi:hypothetical protein